MFCLKRCTFNLFYILTLYCEFCIILFLYKTVSDQLAIKNKPE